MVMKFTVKLLGGFLNILNTLLPSIGTKIAYYIFCYPIKFKLQPRQINYLKKHLQGYIEFDDQKVALYKFGKGPKIILFLHGWRSNAYRWKNFIKALDHQEFTCFAIDAPAHGLSSTKTCNIPIYTKAIYQTLQNIPPPNAIVGHSFGCISTLYLYNKHPEVIPPKTVLLASPGKAQDFVDFYQNALSLSERTMQYLVQYFIDKFGVSIDYFDVSTLVKGYVQECLIVHDKQDKDVDVQYAYTIQKRWKNSELLITEGYGHKLTQPEIIEKAGGFVTKN